jgi:cardiolipin synthase
MGHAFRLKMLRNILAAIPNALSFARLLLGLIFPWLAPIWRLPVLIIGALTDLLDGFLSRTLHASSRAGRFLDPLADKVFVASLVLTMLWEKALSPWEALGIGCRDVVVITGTFVLIGAGRWRAFDEMAPTWLGKLTTAGQFAFFLVLFAVPEYKDWLFFPVAALSCCAGGQYLWQFLVFQMARQRRTKG